MNITKYDAIIIGGGAAGLSAAMVLGRARRNVLLVDNQKQSNLIAEEAHAVFTRDRSKPSELYEIARTQISKYATVTIINDSVLEAKSIKMGFQVTVSKSRVFESSVVLLSQGMKYTPLGIKGANELFGKKAWHCPYCEGYEARGKKVLAVYESAAQAHMSNLLPLWIDDLHFKKPGEVIELKNIPEGVLAVMGDGSEERFDQVAIQANLSQRDDIYSQLHCSIGSTDRVIVDQFGATTTKGVFAAGDQASDVNQVNLAVAGGHAVGIRINSYLLGLKNH